MIEGYFQSCSICPSSAYTAVGAAYQTLGLYLQADILYQFRATYFSHWATFLYVLGAIGGIISLAMGQPPKQYLWFFLGPGIYNWLIFTLVPVTGVQWKVAGVVQDQAQVWRLAEAGLANTNIASGFNVKSFKDKEPQISGSSSQLQVANAYLFIDELLSENIQWLTAWVCIFNFRGVGGTDSNVYGDSKGAPSFGSTTGGGNDSASWHILANLKWGMLENITAVTLRSADARDVFVTMLSNECGDAFKKSIDSARYISAQRTKGKKDTLPNSIFKTKSPSSSGGTPSAPDLDIPMKELAGLWVPTPESLRKLYDDRESEGAFAKFDEYYSGEKPLKAGEFDTVNCMNLVDDVIQLFRWESGLAKHHVELSAPKGITADSVWKALFYGWDVRETPDGDLLTKSPDKIKLFVTDMILAHIVRNEIEVAPPIVDTKFAPSTQSVDYAETYVRTVGSKNKMGELYTWAIMMPYIQGILLYLLTGAYPFAAMLIVIPGWHKSFTTWLSFFCWVKLWDFGFAMTHSIERMLWAQLGNNTSIASISPKIAAMQKIGSVGTSCTGGATPPVTGGAVGGFGVVSAEKMAACAVPMVCSNAGGSATCSGSGTHLELSKSMQIFDQALAVGTSLDLDIANGYYIYIMAALYFAVPAVTGQVVLGSRAGAASMVSGLVSSTAGQAGNASGQAFQGEQATRIQSNLQGTAPQANMAARMRQTGMGAAALDAGNSALRHGMQGSHASAQATGARGMETYANQQLTGLNNAVGAAAHLFDNMAFGRSLGGLYAAGLSGHDQNALGQKLRMGANIGAIGIFSSGGGSASYRGVDLPPPGTGSNGAASAGDTEAIQSALGMAASGDDATSFNQLRAAYPNVPLPPGITDTNPQDAGGGEAVQAAPDGVAGAGPAGAGKPKTWGQILNDPSFKGITAEQAVGVFGRGGMHAMVMAQANQALGAAWAANRVGADANTAGFVHGASRDGANLNGQRMTQAANFDAESANWAFKNANANAMAGRASVWGVMAGSLSPGQKPSGIEGMAMSGMLGSHAESLASYPMGDFRRDVQDRGSQLQGAYGPSSMGFAAPTVSVGDVTNNAVSRGHELIGPQAAGMLGTAGAAPFNALTGTFGGPQLMPQTMNDRSAFDLKNRTNSTPVAPFGSGQLPAPAPARPK